MAWREGRSCRSPGCAGHTVDHAPCPSGVRGILSVHVVDRPRPCPRPRPRPRPRRDLNLVRIRALVLAFTIDPYRERDRTAFANAYTAFNQALHGFTDADLRDVDPTNVELEGLRWSPTTRWPQGWVDQLVLDSVEVAPDVFEVRGGTAHAFTPV